MEFGPSQANIAPAGVGTPPLLLRAADWLSDAAGFFRRPLVAEELIAVAQRRTGLTDFGEWQFIAPSRALLQACEGEAALGAFGRFALQWDVLRFLENLLQLRAAEKASSAPNSCYRTADLRHRLTAQRHQLFAYSACRGCGQRRAALLADNPSGGRR